MRLLERSEVHVGAPRRDEVETSPQPTANQRRSFTASFAGVLASAGADRFASASALREALEMIGRVSVPPEARKKEALDQAAFDKAKAALLTKPSALPADALSLVRWHANQLVGDLRAAQAKGGSVETRAHVAESLSLLTEALRATMSRV